MIKKMVVFVDLGKSEKRETSFRQVKWKTAYTFSVLVEIDGVESDFYISESYEAFGNTKAESRETAYDRGYAQANKYSMKLINSMLAQAKDEEVA